MNNTSTSEDDNGYVPSSMLSFVSTMENNANTSDSKNNKHSQVWDWVDYGNNNHHHQLAATPTPVVTATPPFLSNAGANPFLDCQSSLLPMPPSNFPFYSPLQPDFQHQHQPNGLIKMEDCSDMVAVGQIGLNLGHRTYFSSGDTLAIDRLFRRSRGLYQMNQQIPRCQAEGCKADLSGAKHYHRRHKVCEFHSKATVVVANGLQQRFCQQCSRFHVLGEFDEAKRSCRKRLADHNRRRRKPQPTTSQSSTDPSAPNNSTETSNDETKQQNQTSMNQISSRQICSTNTGTPISSCTAASAATVCTFATNSMCIDSPKDRNHNHHHHHLNHSSSGNDNKVTLSSNGPCLSLGGAEEGNFGFYSNNSYNHQSSRPFVVMSDDDNSHYHHNNNHMSTSSSSATYYHHSHHNFFNEASQSSPVVRPSDQSSDQQQHANQMQHLGQGLFEVDFM